MKTIFTYVKSSKDRIRQSVFVTSPGVAQRVGRGIALLFHDRGTRRGWVVSSTPRPYFTPGKDPVAIVQEAGWAPGPIWTGGKSRPTGIRSPDRPARSQSLYRLSCPAHQTTVYHWQIYLHEDRLTTLKKKLCKDNKLSSCMFRPSRGHFQADIWNMLWRIQIMCGREISLLICFCYKSGLYIRVQLNAKLHNIRRMSSFHCGARHAVEWYESRNVETPCM